MSSGGPEREFNQSLAKGLAAIEAFGDGGPPMTLSDVARKVGLTPGSARRVVQTLETLGYVTCASGRYALLPRALRLGYAYLSSLPLTNLVQPLLTKLTQQLDQSCSLAMLDGLDAVFVARSAAPRLARDYMLVGGRLPAHATSFGKVMLAGLAQDKLADFLRRSSFARLTPRTIGTERALLAELLRVRQQGWALNDQESILGLRSIAVPIAVKGSVVAALGLSAEVSQIDPGPMVKRYLAPLQSAADGLSQSLDAGGFPQARFDE
jgi:IclR family transcriptional regulator, pca regulon regulatory protein